MSTLPARLSATPSGSPPREVLAGVRLEMWVGLAQLVAHGGTERRPRCVRISDAGTTGFELEASLRDAAGVELGDLVGWRKGIGNALVVGQVVRRMAAPTGGQVYLGVKALTQWAMPMSLTLAAGSGNAAGSGVYVFVPGDDDSGRRDAFLVAEKSFELDATYHAQVGAETFVLMFNRVRGRGRGWVLAGFEIVPGKPCGAADASLYSSLDAARRSVRRSTMAR